MDVMKTSKDGFDFILKHSTFRSEPYAGKENRYYIGYGSGWDESGSKITPKSPAIDREQAEYLLHLSIDRIEYFVNKYVTVSLLQHQYDALVSFAFSVERMGFINSAVLRLVNEQAYHLEIVFAWLKWNTIDERFNKHMAMRRHAEVDMFFKHLDDEQ